MLTCLLVHCVGFGMGVGLIAGFGWAPLGVAVGVAFALWDELQERRGGHAVVVTRARRGSPG